MTEEERKDSPAYKVAFQAGYQEAKLRDKNEKIDNKLTMAKWAYRIVSLLGIRRSAKLGYKGYKAKKKIEHLTGKDDKKKVQETRVPSREERSAKQERTDR
jgi:hypothetical protein